MSVRIPRIGTPSTKEWAYSAKAQEDKVTKPVNAEERMNCEMGATVGVIALD